MGENEPKKLTEEELRELQYNAALRYVQGVRDYMLTVEWKSVRYYANFFSLAKETSND